MGTTTLLSLPEPVRLKIYKLCLVTKEEVQPRSSRLRNSPDQSNALGICLGPFATPALLRTCRHVYREATPILYAGNTFVLDKAPVLCDWLDEIGRLNTQHVTRIQLFPSYIRPLEPWYKALRKLALRAPGIRYVHVCFDGGRPGKDVDFMRHLAALQCVQEITIKGIYAKRWPEYLRAQFGSRYVHISQQHSAEG